MNRNRTAPPAQLPAWLIAKPEADRFHTNSSTQQTTAREQPQHPPQHCDPYNMRNHISLVESAVEERPVTVRKPQPASNTQEVFHSSSSSVPYEQTGRSRSRRNRIFDDSYVPHIKQPSRERSSHQKGGNASRCFSEKKKSFVFSPVQPVTPLASQQMASLGRFIDSIPLVPAHTVVRVNSSNVFLPASASHPRVTFTYQHLPSTLQSAKLNCRSNPQLHQHAPNVHSNPAQAKICKPSPRKPTIITQLQQLSQPRKFISSKASLNIRESVVGGYSLATEKHAPEDCISNIELNSSRRHFDEEEAALGQKISFKNIDINDSQERSEQAETQAHNIFSDFQLNRKQEMEREARKREKIDVSAVLEKLDLQEKCQESAGGGCLSALLVGTAVLLLLVQLWGR